MTRDLGNIMSVFQGSNGEATTALYNDLRLLGSAGYVALELFRAQKSSSRAKAYRGSSKGKAYDTKQWAMDNLTTALATLGTLPWGWKFDPTQSFHNWVLYVDLAAGNQVSFHTAERGHGPDYAGEWDGVRNMGPQRICCFVAGLCAQVPA
jgi:hypothetical protein